MKEILAQFARQAGVTIDILEQTDSTNNRAAESRYGAGDVVIAERQEAGRGQRGNSWSSTPGENLTFSVVLRPDFLPAERQFRISKAVALAVADTIAEAGLRPAIKWPNDIYIGDRKVTGILIENDLMGPYLSRSVIGIGLNVNQTRFDPALPNPTSLAAEAGHPFDRAEVFISFYRHLAERYRTLAGEETGETGKTGKTGPVPDTGGQPNGQAGRNRRHGRRLHAAPDRIRLPIDTRLGLPAAALPTRTGAPVHRRTHTAAIPRHDHGVQPGGELEVRHSADGQLRKYLFKEIEYVIGTPEP